MRICCRLSTVLHMTQTTGGNAATAGRLVLLRHGQTVWSESGQHTGRTDIPLTAEGERQARDAGTRIQTAFPQGYGENCVYASPLKRAQQTASLAGFAPRTLPALAEWDYGRAEGRTRQEVSAVGGFAWDVWRDGPQALPESLEGDWIETCRTASRCPCTTVRVRRWRKLRRAHVRRSPRSNRCSTLETMCCWWRMRTFFVS